MCRFKVGDYVRIRTWDDMAAEFGIDGDGDITIGSIATNPFETTYFTGGMESLCGHIYKIINDWGFDEISLDICDLDPDAPTSIWDYCIVPEMCELYCPDDGVTDVQIDADRLMSLLRKEG